MRDRRQQWRRRRIGRGQVQQCGGDQDHPVSSARWQATIAAHRAAATPEPAVRHHVDRDRAAGMKAATGRWRGRTGDFSGQRHPRLGTLHHRIGLRHRREQGPRIGVARRGVQRIARCDFDEHAEIHHRHPIADMPHHRQVVRHEQARHRQPRLQLDQQIKDLGAHRNIQRGHWLVAHQQRRPQRERAGNHNALALAAAELVRVARRVLRPQPDLLQQRCDAVLRSARPRGDAAHQQRLADRVADGHAWIERGDGVLEHHLHSRPHGPQRAAVGAGQFARRARARCPASAAAIRRWRWTRWTCRTRTRQPAQASPPPAMPRTRHRPPAPAAPGRAGKCTARYAQPAGPPSPPP